VNPDFGVGLFVGLFVGYVVGILINALLGRRQHWLDDAKEASATIGLVVSICGLCFGSPWLTTGLLGAVDAEAFRLPYVASLSVVALALSHRAAFQHSNEAAAVTHAG
jgi:hypothetical protein